MKFLPEDSNSCYHSIVSTYEVYIENTSYNTMIKWSKSRLNNFLTISIHDSTSCNLKIDMKSWAWPFVTNKGSKRLNIDGNNSQIDVYWDFKSLRLGHGPEPLGGYYVAMVYGNELVLLLGDCDKMAYKKTKAIPPFMEPTLVSKRESVFGKKTFSSRIRFDKKKKEHDVVIENTISEMDSEMSINIDGVEAIHVSNLQWKFRGNETIMVDNEPIQVFWDVHSWLATPGAGHGTILFKPGTLQEDELNGGVDREVGLDMSSNSILREIGLSSFCFFLYIWKLE